MQLSSNDRCVSSRCSFSALRRSSVFRRFASSRTSGFSASFASSPCMSYLHTDYEQDDARTGAPRVDAAPIEQQLTPPEAGELVFDREALEVLALGQALFEQPPQRGDVPLRVVERVQALTLHVLGAERK